MMLHSEVLSDVTELRSQLRARDNPHRDLLHLSLARPLADIGFDWLVILACVAAVVGLHSWLVPLAVCLIANRQRALGNILHEAGHRNLWRDAAINDVLARVLVAPLLFASLTSYRAAHARHHLALGDGRHDPDILPIPPTAARHWLISYRRNLSSWPAWLGSLLGHFVARDVPVTSKLFMLAWWGVALALLDGFTSREFAVVFVALWITSRATVFHLITTFREMCDHFGLRPGGIFTFTRDIASHGFLRHLIHPRNNGYHLTHHLLPAVPYYRLPEAHRLFQDMPAYRARAHVCHAYFSRACGVTRDWQAGAGA